MSLGRILVPLDGSERDQISLLTAVRAAKPFKAHVAVVFAHPDPAELWPVVGVPLSAEAMSAVIDGNLQIFHEQSAHIRSTMENIAAMEGARIVDGPCRGNTATLSYREMIGYPPETIGNAARLADLTVCGPAEGSPRLFETAIDIVLQNRRPVLMASHPPPAFRKVVIGCNGSIAAMNAISAAMPILEQADVVQLVCIEHALGPSVDTDPLIAYLRSHGISPSELHLGKWGTLSNDLLLKLAQEHNADLLVVGAFGHSRIGETIFGGVTNEILRRAPLPVLLAH